MLKTCINVINNFTMKASISTDIYILNIRHHLFVMDRVKKKQTYSIFTIVCFPLHIFYNRHWFPVESHGGPRRLILNDIKIYNFYGSLGYQRLIWLMNMNQKAEPPDLWIKHRIFVIKFTLTTSYIFFLTISYMFLSWLS